MKVIEQLSDPSRRAILISLSSGRKNVSELVAETGLKQPNVSNHLARLRESGIVVAEKSGRSVHYEIATPQMLALVTSLTSGQSEASEFDLEEESSRFAEAALGGLIANCNQILRHALRNKLGFIEVVEHLFLPTMVLVGKRYESGEIHEAQEHMASEIIKQCSATALSYLTPAASNGMVAILGAHANNQHTLGLKILSDLLTLRGWSVRYMGANVPTAAFVEVVASVQPQAVFVSIGPAASLRDAQECLRALAGLQRSGARFALVIGGPVFDEVRHHLDPIDAVVVTDIRKFDEQQLPALTGPVSGTKRQA